MNKKTGTYSRGWYFYHGLILVLFHTTLFMLVFASVLRGCQQSILNLPISVPFIMRLRTIGSVLLIIYLITIIPITNPAKLLTSVGVITAVTLLSGEIAKTLVDLIPESWALGALVFFGFASIFGIFMIFFQDLMLFLIGAPLVLVGAASAFIAAATSYLPTKAEGAADFPYRKTCQYAGALAAILLIITSGLWYKPLWNESYYQKGVKAAEQGDLYAAKGYLGTCGNYKDAAELYSQYGDELYKTEADEAMAEGDYDKAASYYDIVGEDYTADTARIKAAIESGDLMSVWDDLIARLKDGNLEYYEETMELIRENPDKFTVGDTYYMGKYVNYQGTEVPLKWLVVWENDDTMVLISKVLLTAHTFSEEGSDFASSDLYAYLNGEFTETSFTEADLNCMLTAEEFYSDHPEDFSGYVMIPARSDIENFSSVENFDDLLDSEWWLRDTYSDGGYDMAYFVKEDGSIGSRDMTGSICARPMIFIKK